MIIKEISILDKFELILLIIMNSVFRIVISGVIGNLGVENGCLEVGCCFFKIKILMKVVM